MGSEGCILYEILSALKDNHLVLTGPILVSHETGIVVTGVLSVVPSTTIDSGRENNKSCSSLFKER